MGAAAAHDRRGRGARRSFSARARHAAFLQAHGHSRKETWASRPLHFEPGPKAFWDGSRGVAIGGACPWLIAYTKDGGETWVIADASEYPLGPPQLRGPGRARIAFRHCDKNCHGSRFAITRDYGRDWTA